MRQRQHKLYMRIRSQTTYLNTYTWNMECKMCPIVIGRMPHSRSSIYHEEVSCRHCCLLLLLLLLLCFFPTHTVLFFPFSLFGFVVFAPLVISIHFPHIHNIVCKSTQMLIHAKRLENAFFSLSPCTLISSHLVHISTCIKTK